MVNYSASHSLSFVHIQYSYSSSRYAQLRLHLSISCWCLCLLRFVCTFDLSEIVCVCAIHLSTIALFMRIKCKIYVYVFVATVFFSSLTNTQTNVVWHFRCLSKHNRHSQYIENVGTHHSTTYGHFAAATLFLICSFQWDRRKQRMYARTE